MIQRVPSSSSTEMSSGFVGKPLPIIVRVSPPAISTTNGVTELASKGVTTVIGIIWKQKNTVRVFQNVMNGAMI